MKARWTVAALLLTALVASTALTSSAPLTPAKTVAGRPTFGSPAIVDPIHAYGEPDIRVAYNGNTYVSGPWGTGTQRSIWNRSSDGGWTYVGMHQEPISSPDESATLIPGPGGGDTELAIDHNNNVYYSDLAALASLKNGLWNDKEKTLTTQTIANPPQNINGYDRQWFGLWDPAPDEVAEARAVSGYTGKLPVNYLLFAEALAGSSCPSGSCESAAYSYDGVNYSASTTSYDMQNDGPLVVDQLTGTVFEAISVEGLGDVGVAMTSRKAGQDPEDPSLTKTEIVKIADLPEGMTTRLLFPVVAIDSARNLYIAWGTRAETPQSENKLGWQVFYSWASADSGWRDWSKPVQLSSPPSNTNVMPWAIAGSEGRLAVVWYGSDDSTHNPSVDNAHQKWDVYLANITNAASDTPKIQQIKVTKHPMHYGTICLEGTGCIAVAGNRNLADFFEVGIDPRDGAIVVAYNDSSNDITQTVANGEQVPDSAADHRGAPLVTVVRQTGGTGLYGTAIKGPPTAGRSLRDRARDAFWDPLYGDADSLVSQLDVRGAKIVRKKKKKVVVKMKASSLENFSDGLSATGAQALNWVARWSGKKGKGDTLRNPIYYVGAETTGSDPTFYAGDAFTYELCSVSGCYPHGFLYPSPPLGGTEVKGKVVVTPGPKPDYFVIKVPRKLVGVKKKATKLESFSLFAFASPRSASQPPTNSEAEADRMPVLVDAVCCRNATL